MDFALVFPTNGFQYATVMDVIKKIYYKKYFLTCKFFIILHDSDSPCARYTGFLNNTYQQVIFGFLSISFKSLNWS